MKTVDEDWVTGRLEFHRSRRDQSFRSYSIEKLFPFNAAAAAPKKIYLDLKFWILLRDSRLGRSTSVVARDLFDALTTAASSGRIVCPISDVIYLELCKQRDIETLRASADLMNELSCGICLPSESDRNEMEFARFLEATGLSDDIPPELTMKWVPPGFLLGMRAPRAQGMDEAFADLIDKVFLDQMWTVTIQDLAPKDALRADQQYDFEGSAARINASSRSLDSEVQSFQQVAVAEVWSFARDIAKKNGARLARVLTELGLVNSATAASGAKNIELFCQQVLGNLFRERPDYFASHFPTAYVHSMCHAAIRWDKERRLVGNDLADIHHATGAIPNCDAFFTERSLKALLLERLRMDDKFGCEVIADPAEALVFAHRLLNS